MNLRATARFTPRSNLGQFIPAVVTPAVRAGTQAAGQLVQQTAQGYCPVETGALRDSIRVSMVDSDKTVTAVVSAGMPYASYVEYGTGRRGGPAPYPHVESWPGMPAQPYMRPALDESRDAVRELFRNQLSLAIAH